MNHEPFMKEMGRLADRIAPYGAANGLSQALLKLCSPGIPDVYQGSELWNQSLVDPDNRRPIDFDLRRRLLAEISADAADASAGFAGKLLDQYADGRIKLYVVHRALELRKQAPELFLRGDYQPVESDEHVVAFTRAHGAQRLVCCATRLPYRKTRGEAPFAVGAVWGQSTLRLPHAGRYLDVLSRRELVVGPETPLSELFAELPLALLLLRERGRRG
jgi:(1->4)-alpha-D-glucan 1-alpha-D-glucosylmutase